MTGQRGRLSAVAPKVMGVINVTPDSFSDIVRYSGKEAVERMFLME